MKDDWSRAARGFEKISAGLYADATRPFFAFAGLRPGMSVLDVACGPGVSTRLAAELLGRGGRVLGVDASPAMLALARRRSRRETRARFARADAHCLSAPDAAYDAVVCHLGLMLFDRPHVALRELVRVAKPGAPVACLVLGRAERMAFTGIFAALAPGIHDLGKPGRLAAAMKRAGLRSVATRRLRGRFALPSPRRYWELVREGFGRVGPALRALPPARRRALRSAVTARLKAYTKNGRVEIPYEFVMARGRR